MTKKYKIIVYDNDQKTNSNDNFITNEYNVTFKKIEAYCIGGKEGILAFWIENNYCYIAAGDDGNWWLIDKFGKSWLKEIKELFLNLIKEKII